MKGRVSFQDWEKQHVTFREFTFAEAEKIEILIARTETRFVLEDWHA